MTKLPTARITPPSTGPYLASRLEHGEFLVLRLLVRQDLVQATGSARRDKGRLVNDDSRSPVKDANIHGQRSRYLHKLIVTL